MTDLSLYVCAWSFHVCVCVSLSTHIQHTHITHTHTLVHPHLQAQERGELKASLVISSFGSRLAPFLKAFQSPQGYARTQAYAHSHKCTITNAHTHTRTTLSSCPLLQSSSAHTQTQTHTCTTRQFGGRVCEQKRERKSARECEQKRERKSTRENERKGVWLWDGCSGGAGGGSGKER